MLIIWSKSIYIKKFEKDYNRILEYKFIQAYPISIDQMPVTYNASDLLKCTVNFNFSRYLVNKVNNQPIMGPLPDVNLPGVNFPTIGNPVIKEIISIVEKFLVKTQRVCYGGTAINNILPEEEQFYDKSIELPDYDFFSPEPLKDAKDLADIFNKHGFNEVEAKAGMHAGTFKVFVNFIPVADISFLPKELYKKIHKKSKK